MRIAMVLFAILATGSPVPGIADQPSSGQMTVRGLLEQGWTVATRGSRNETRPGLPPYEKLPRVISITTYTLRRGDERVSCEMTYDSQLDHLQESCRRLGAGS